MIPWLVRRLAALLGAVLCNRWVAPVIWGITFGYGLGFSFVALSAGNGAAFQLAVIITIAGAVQMVRTSWRAANNVRNYLYILSIVGIVAGFAIAGMYGIRAFGTVGAFALVYAILWHFFKPKKKKKRSGGSGSSNRGGGDSDDDD